MSAEFQLPVDRVLEQGTRLGALILDEYEETLVYNRIDWTAETASDAAVQDITGVFATESHYENMAHLILCGEIIRFGVESDTLDAQRIAVRLAAYKMEDVTVWGRYLGRTTAGYEISSQLREYYNLLFAETNVLAIFIGIETITGPFSINLFQHLQNVADPLYREITTHLIEQKQDEMAFVQNGLEEVIEELSAAERDAVHRQVARYRERADNLLDTHRDRLAATGVDVDALRQDVHTGIDDFHGALGLTA